MSEEGNLELAKRALDVGLFTSELEPMLNFWQTQVGVPFAERLPLGGGLNQYRHAIGESVLKVNHSPEPLPEADLAGFRRLTLVRAGLEQVCELEDPDGNPVVLVPEGSEGIVQLRLSLVVTDLDRHRAFYGGVLGLPERRPGLFEVGVSQLELHEGHACLDPVQRARGYRYITLQVFDVRGVHAHILSRGGREGMAPVKVGDVAHISFVRDQDGNWLEISQRKSITGSLD
ncbi:MAG TPA: VOC family protein [Pseudomonadales bacterium]